MRATSDHATASAAAKPTARRGRPGGAIAIAARAVASALAPTARAGSSTATAEAVSAAAASAVAPSVRMSRALAPVTRGEAIAGRASAGSGGLGGRDLEQKRLGRVVRGERALDLQLL